MTQYGLKEIKFDDDVKEIESKLSLDIEILNAEIELLKLKIKSFEIQKQILASLYESWNEPTCTIN